MGPRLFFLVVFKDKTMKLMRRHPKKEDYEKGTYFFRTDEDETLGYIWDNIIKELPDK